VRFAYDPEVRSSEVQLEVPAQDKGRDRRTSGAGKSTISRLLFRLYDVTSGKIRSTAGHPERHAGFVACLDRQWCRRYRSVQRPHPLQHRYGRVGAGDAEVERRRNSRDRPFYPEVAEGYETQVGDGA